MAFVPVPKDLNRVKTKVMFNLTKRQLICFALAAAAGVPIFFLTKPSLGISTSAMLMVVIMLPFIFFALYEKDGQPAEKILGHVIKSMFLRDKVRPYRTSNLYAAHPAGNQREGGIADCTAARKRPQSLSGLPKTARCTAIFSPLRKRRSWSCRRKRPRRQRKSVSRRSRLSPMWRCAATASARSTAASTQRLSVSTTSTTSSPRTRTKRLSLRTGATF